MGVEMVHERSSYRDTTKALPDTVAGGIRGNSEVNIQTRLATGGIFRRNQDAPLSLEERRYLDILGAGSLFGIPITVDGIRAVDSSLHPAIGRMPHPDLAREWSTTPLTDGSELIAPFNETASMIRNARTIDVCDRLTVVPTGDHVEALDFSTEGVLREAFFSLENNKGLGARRMEMLAGLSAHGVKEAIARKGHATIVDFGTGPFPLQRKLIERLTPDERSKTTIVGIDVSEDLIRYGLAQNYIDKGIVADVSTLDSTELIDLLPDVDVVNYAQILEHIDHPAAVFEEVMMPWFRHTKAKLIGSVPNAVQLKELYGILTGTGTPNQLRRPTFDPTLDHRSFMTVESLSAMLDQWGFIDSGIVSNGVRIVGNGDNSDLYAGLTSPQLGGALIFWGDMEKNSEVNRRENPPAH